MPDTPRARPNQWRDFINLLLGVWIFVSPWALNFSTNQSAAWNAYVVGLVVVVAAIAAIVQFHRWEEWVNILLGAWLIASPWVLAVSMIQALMWNQIIVGVIICALAIWSAIAGYEPGSMGSDTTAREH